MLSTLAPLSRFHLVSATVLATLLSTSSAIVQGSEPTSKWSVLVGAAHLNTHDDSGSLSGPGLPPDSTVSISNAVTDVVAINYQYSPHTSFQFLMSTPIEFEVNATGNIAGLGEIATTRIQPPTLMFNYTFGDNTWWARPFTGIGINYTKFIEENPAPILSGALGGQTSIDLDDSWGAVVQIGLDFKIGNSKRWYGRAAFAYIDIDTEATITTPAAGTVRTIDVEVDPTVTYLQLGYRF